MRKFQDYIKFREAEDIAGSIFLSAKEGNQEALSLAWKRYKHQVISFLKSLNDPEIDEALEKNNDDGENDKDKQKRGLDDNADVVVPKADGSPGMEDEGGGE